MGIDLQTCQRCIMDSSDPDIIFDDQGICNHCTSALDRIQKDQVPLGQRETVLQQLVNRIKTEGRKKEYDCIIGVSGGVDSSMTAYYVKEMGLRPLAIHFDNGWDSELAVNNIKNVLHNLNIDLRTHVVDWEEFRSLQLCFLKASVANCEIPTDHAIMALLWRKAYQHRVRFILTGSNLMTESIMPYAWGHYCQDLRHLKALHKLWGTKPLVSTPTISLTQYLYFVFIKKIRQVPFLNYFDYNKNNAKKFLIEHLGWRDYGGKHYESIWTRFFQGHYLPAKFGFDKRKAHLSSMICAGQETREHALQEMKEPHYPENLLKQDIQFVLKKFNLTAKEFELIIKAPPKKATDYPSNYFLFETLKKYKNIFRKLATSP